jgi:hypothetical protein
VEPGVSLRQLSVATDLLAAPTRPAAEPDWPTDWGQALTWGGAGLALLLLGGFWWWAGRRAGD